MIRIYHHSLEYETSNFPTTLKPESGPESGPESIMQRVLAALEAKPLSKSELAITIGQKSISGKLNQRIREMLAEGLVEYTLPDKPNSRLQKYQIAEKGRRLIPNDKEQ